MNKFTILESAIGSLKLSEEEFLDLRQQLDDYERLHKFATVEELAKGIENDFPHLRILHDATMRRYALVTAVNSSVIKTLLVICFIFSAIAAIVLLTGTK